MEAVNSPQWQSILLKTRTPVSREELKWKITRAYDEALAGCQEYATSALFPEYSPKHPENESKRRFAPNASIIPYCHIDGVPHLLFLKARDNATGEEYWRPPLIKIAENETPD